MVFPSRLRWLWLTLVVVMADRASKAWFEVSTPVGWRHEIVHNFIYLVHSVNPGIAFSFFADSSSPWLKTILIAGSILVVIILTWLLISGQNRRSDDFCGAGVADCWRNRERYRPHSARRSDGFSGSVDWHVPLAGI